MYHGEAEYYHARDMEAQYAAEMDAMARAEADYEAQVQKQIIEQINNIENMILEKESEIESLREEIHRLNTLL